MHHERFSGDEACVRPIGYNKEEGIGRCLPDPAVYATPPLRTPCRGKHGQTLSLYTMFTHFLLVPHDSIAWQRGTVETWRVRSSNRRLHFARQLARIDNPKRRVRWISAWNRAPAVVVALAEVAETATPVAAQAACTEPGF